MEIFCTIAVFLVTITVTLIWIAYAGVKRSIPQKFPRKQALQSTFTTFSAANKAARLLHFQIGGFWESTSDVYTLFGTGSISNLRQSLYDNAVMLVHLRERLNRGEADDDVRGELLIIQQETLVWFDLTTQRIEGIFQPELKQFPSVKAVWQEFLHIALRTIRA